MPSQFKNIEIQDTGFLTLPSGTSAERPASPESGMIRYNTDLGTTEWYDSDRSDWFPLRDTNQFVSATGGTVVDTAINGRPYRLHYFTETGADTFSVTAGGEVEYLIVAGGGSGGNGYGGGGGAGGVVSGTTTITPQSYTITVGNGAPSKVVNDNRVTGDNGENSTAFGLTALGGGGGGGQSNPSGLNGGSGGGNAGSAGGNPGVGLQSASASGGFGNNGGAGNGTPGAGGGGAGSAGGDSSGDVAGNGGIGISSLITGTAQFFAGGGGGANTSGGIETQSTSRGLGGSGGGGIGQGRSIFDGSTGAPNTGGGSGGSDGRYFSPSTFPGGSGIVIVRYPRDPDASYSAPDRTISSTLPGNFNIIQDGLVFNVDAQKATSYNGFGNTWVDQTGFGNNGSLQNAPSFQQEYQGYFAFNGSNQWVSVPTSNNSSDALSNFGNMTGDDTNAWSVEVWFRTLSVFGSSERTGAPLFYRDDGDLYAGMIVYNGFLRWAHYNSGWETDITSNTFVSDGVWHHAVYVNFSNSTGNLYVDGRLEVSGATSSMNDGRYFIPSAIARGYSNTFLDGDIAAARLYDKSLSEQEIRHNFNVTRGRFGV